MAIFFAFIAAAFIGTATAFLPPGNANIDDPLIRAPVVNAVHLQGEIGTNGRFTSLHAVERSDDAEIIVRDAIHSAGLQSTQWELLSRYVTKRSGVTHIAMQQKVNGLLCSNCLLVCNIDARGRVINLAYTAHAVGPAPDKTPSISARTALDVVLGLWNATAPSTIKLKERSEEKEVYAAMNGLSPEDVSISLTTLVTEDDKSELTWHVVIEKEQPDDHMYEIWVEARPSDPTRIPQVLQVIDLINWDNWGGNSNNHDNIKQAPNPAKGVLPKNTSKPALDGTYEVYAIPHLDPDLGVRQVRGDDVDTRASPIGWHDRGSDTYTVTIGNNVCAQDNPNALSTRGCIDTFRPDGGANLEFRYEFDQFSDPRSSPTLDAAVTNLFYWHNVIHDIMYVYGFDEPSGNFQENNFGKGGLGNDGVQANAQDGSGWNNANFATPVDGQRPRCRMYLWNAHVPYKDGDFDSGIIVHEVGHGVSNRLTGGPMSSGCLPSGQSGGMGEGWSDWWAVQLIQEERYRPDDAFPMGGYVSAGGIRNYPYSYDMNINPATFSYLSRSGYTGVHAIGSVWCGILHDVYWDMRADYGFNADWKDETSDAGNIVLWQNVLTGLKLQPCRPTFVDARNAIIQADEQNYGGRHTCTLWCGFARRGLGVSARTSGYTDRNPTEAFDFPDECVCN